MRFYRGRCQNFKSIVKCFTLDNRQAKDRHVVQFVKSVFPQKPLSKTFTRVACNVTCPEDKLNIVFSRTCNARDSFPQGPPEKQSKPVPQRSETKHSCVGRLDGWLQRGPSCPGFDHQRIASQRRHVDLPEVKFVSSLEIRTDHFNEHALRSGLQNPTWCCGCSQLGAEPVPWTRLVCHGLFSRCHQ